MKTSKKDVKSSVQAINPPKSDLLALREDAEKFNREAYSFAKVDRLSKCGYATMYKVKWNIKLVRKSLNCNTLLGKNLNCNNLLRKRLNYNTLLS